MAGFQQIIQGRGVQFIQLQDIAVRIVDDKIVLERSHISVQEFCIEEDSGIHKRLPGWFRFKNCGGDVLIPSY